MPLLARVAPALAPVPGSALKSATYADAAWTLELPALDDPTANALVQRVAATGVPVVHARSESGVRMRIGPLP